MVILSKNILLLTFLYFIQGLPFGFQTNFLPIVLRRHGISLTRLGFFRLLFLPWLCRGLWAPLVDMYGTKHKWLLASILGLVLTCLLGSLGSPEDLVFLCVILLLLNVFAATQDIVVDGVAIAILASDELGGGNTAQVVGYKIGAIFGGGVLIWLMNVVGWTGMFVGLALLYLEAFMFVYVSPELREFEHEHPLLQPTVDGYGQSGTSIDRQTEQEVDNWRDISESLAEDIDDQSSDTSSECLRNRFYSTLQAHYVEKDVQEEMPKTWLSIFDRVIHVPGTSWMLVYILIYKLGEAGVQNMLPLYMVDSDIPHDSVVFLTGFIGQILSITGSLLGGWALSYCGLPVYLVLEQCLLMRLFPVGLITVCVAVSMPAMLTHTLPYYVAVTSYCLLQLNSGIITTATFTMMMQCSQRAPSDIQTTHYTVLSTFEVFGKLMFASVTGLVTDLAGYPPAFVLFILLGVAVLPWYRKCPYPLCEVSSRQVT